MYMAKTNQQSDRSRSNWKTEVRRRRRRWRLTPQHQNNKLFLPLTPAVNAGPRRHARLRDVSVARLLALVFMSMSGAVCQRRAPDWTRQEADNVGSNHRGEGDW